MSVTQSLPTIELESRARSFAKTEVMLGLLVGLAGGAVQSLALGTPVTHEAAVGAAFGLAFALLFDRRATSAGAGLIWGLAAAFLMWVVFPARVGPLYSRGFHSMGAVGDARDQFPLLMGHLVCLGMPVGLVLGIRNGMRATASESQFNWTRAMVAGGLAGVLGGTIFDRWMSAGEFFPLLSGLSAKLSPGGSLVLQFLIAVLMGVIFGVLVGHILYGLILGVTYATIDRMWVRLFIQSDPLNREPHGPGLRVLQSLGWGAVAGLAGGLVASPIMLKAGVLTRV